MGFIMESVDLPGYRRNPSLMGSFNHILYSRSKEIRNSVDDFQGKGKRIYHISRKLSLYLTDCVHEDNADSGYGILHRNLATCGCYEETV